MEKKEKMILLRQVPIALHKKLKTLAASSGLTIENFIIKLLERGVR